MATISDVTTIEKSGVLTIDALLNDGPAWNYLTPSPGNVIYYTFADDGSHDEGVSGITTFNAIQAGAARGALGYIESVTGIDFVETAAPSLAQFAFLNADVAGDNISGLASWSYDYSYTDDEQITAYSAEADIFLDVIDFADNLSPTAGSAGYQTLLHEIGHALGLKHPFEGSPQLPASLDDTDHTVMSYTWVGENKTTYQEYDLDALWWIYGGDGLGGQYGINSLYGPVDPLDTTAPTVTTFDPSPANTSVAVGSNIVLSFSEAIQRGTGSIVIKTAAGLVVASYDAATSSQLSISDRVLTINPTDDLSYGTHYQVDFAAGSITDLIGNSYAGTTSYGFTTAARVNNPPTGTVIISGTAAQGQTLTASNTLADLDGLGAIGYQWLADGSTIADATHSTFMLTQAQVGKSISVQASYTDGFGAAEGKTSSSTIAVANVNDAPTGTVSISGTATQGQTLTAANTLADLDGLGPIGYQWLAGGSAILGATGATLVLGQAQVGKAISVAAGYTDGGGAAESKTSTATSAVANVNDPPTGTVNISGTATQGQTLTAVNTLADLDGLGPIGYQWLADGSAISGATSATLVLGQTQVGKTISVAAGYTDGGGTAESKTSTATGAVANVNDPPTGTVSISGTATQGQTLTAVNTLADLDGLGAIGYQWLAGGSAISDATGATLVLSQAQVGKAISVVAGYTDGGGSPESKTSAETGAVANSNDAPTGTVIIGGTAAQGHTLRAANNLDDVDGLGTIAYQWLANGKTVAGAIGDTFTLTQAQVGKTISVMASYTDGFGAAESITSSTTAAVAGFDGLSYIASYADLIQAFGSNAEAGAAHYAAYGLAEGRRITFDGLEYIAGYGDLIQALHRDAAAGAAHYIDWGFTEGRRSTFDGLNYIASYGDLIQAFGSDAAAGAAHYIDWGLTEGRRSTFDGLKYIASYGDLIRAFGNDAEAGTAHYIDYGFAEGRSATFDAEFYLAKYSDLRSAFGTNLDAATNHFIKWGYAENRTADNTGDNVLNGSASAGTLTIDGSDTFDFNALIESGNSSATCGVITDFSAGDRIDLATLDANAATSATDETFAVIGTGAFSSTDATGQLRDVYDGLGGLSTLYGSTDTDADAEFAVQMTGVSGLSAADFIL